ncbi:Coiled-coil domain-containing protein 124 [Thelohanellus kitauei]|uniref:Coiled-coil domain-containing protein 124 n=1 Tax=Thelohanellus kitauei TaxID=669202 RepID=A0A0C2N524_THEKT|nr:Coiled-coil domain-containing protein 124 [Thelohanellus kitauei]
MEQLTGNGVGTPQRMTRKEIADNLKKHGHVGSTAGVTINIAPKKVNNKQTTDNSLTQSYEEELWMKDIPPNLNRINDDVTHARGVDEAINLLKQVNYDQKGNSVDRNPEKRQRASYNAYVEREMERLQTKQPTLSYSQKQQIISKSWQRAPENPVYRKCVERGDLEKFL